jgi:hypothetical protein
MARLPLLFWFPVVIFPRRYRHRAHGDHTRFKKPERTLLVILALWIALATGAAGRRSLEPATPK